jgi:hypothetical protein
MRPLLDARFGEANLAESSFRRRATGAVWECAVLPSKTSRRQYQGGYLRGRELCARTSAGWLAQKRLRLGLGEPDVRRNQRTRICLLATGRIFTGRGLHQAKLEERTLKGAIAGNKL